MAELSKRFWAKVNIAAPDECWEWTAYRNGQGYGKIFISMKAVNAQRVAFCLDKNLPLCEIDGKLVLHSCDNPSCVNPKHLRLGDHLDNVQDMQSRKREANRAGEQNPNSKLTMKIVRTIKTMSAGGANGRMIASRLEIPCGTVVDVLSGKTWSMV